MPDSGFNTFLSFFHSTGLGTEATSAHLVAQCTELIFHILLFVYIYTALHFFDCRYARVGMVALGGQLTLSLGNLN